MTFGVRLKMKWPHDPAVAEAVARLKTACAREPHDEREEAFKERMVAQNLIPEDWYSRFARRRTWMSPAPTDSHLTPARITPDAMEVRAQCVAHAITVDCVARDLLEPLRMRAVWVAATQVLVTLDYDETYGAMRRNCRVYMQGIDGTDIPYCTIGNGWPQDANAADFYQSYRKHEQWLTPLFQLGVFPVVIPNGAHTAVALVCPKTDAGLELFLRQRYIPPYSKHTKPSTFGKPGTTRGTTFDLRCITVD